MIFSCVCVCVFLCYYLFIYKTCGCVVPILLKLFNKQLLLFELKTHNQRLTGSLVCLDFIQCPFELRVHIFMCVRVCECSFLSILLSFLLIHLLSCSLFFSIFHFQLIIVCVFLLVNLFNDVHLQPMCALFADGIVCGLCTRMNKHVGRVFTFVFE